MAKNRNGKPEGMRGAERKYDRAKLTKSICDRLATGKEPMTVICASLGVPVKTVNEWRLADPEIRRQFDEARDLGYDAIAHRTRATARGKREDQGGDSTGDFQRDKLIIDTDLKLLAKWDPRRYGEKQQLEHTGPGGGPITTTNVNVTASDPIEAAAIYQKVMAGEG